MYINKTMLACLGVLAWNWAVSIGKTIKMDTTQQVFLTVNEIRSCEKRSFKTIGQSHRDISRKWIALFCLHLKGKPIFFAFVCLLFVSAYNNNNTTQWVLEIKINGDIANISNDWYVITVCLAKKKPNLHFQSAQHFQN